MNKTLIVTTLLLLSFIPIIQANQPTVTVEVTKYTTSVDVGEEFIIDILMTKESNNVTAWLINSFTYNYPSKLQLINYNLSSNWNTSYSEFGTIDTSNGTIKTIQSFNPDGVDNGEIFLCHFIFKALASGTISFNINGFQVQNSQAEWLQSNIINTTIKINSDEPPSPPPNPPNPPPPTPPTNNEPKANTNGPYYGLTNQSIEFNSTESYDSDGQITLWNWEFGNGEFNECACPTVRYTYFTPGNYTIKLTVTDNDGATDTDYSYAIISYNQTNPPTNNTNNTQPPTNNTNQTNQTNNTEPPTNNTESPTNNQNNTDNTTKESNGSEGLKPQTVAVILIMVLILIISIIYIKWKEKNND